jgi:hypothetical protein
MLDFETKSAEFGTSLNSIESALVALSKKALVVGIVAADERKPDETGHSQEITNSQLGFIFEFGAPEARIPARPVLFPTLEENKDEIKESLMLAAAAALRGDSESMDRVLHSLGLTLVFAIKKRILNFIPPPLAKNTLRKWVTKTKQRKDYGLTPLKVTMQFVNSFNYAVEDR